MTVVSAGPEAGTLLEGQANVLERIARGAPLPEVLRAIAHLIERHSPGTVASILLLHDDHTLHTGAAPSLPETFSRAVDGLRIGPNAGSCGAAAHHNRAVISPDVTRDPIFADYREVMHQHGLRSAWSMPIRGAGGAVLGTFALYSPEPHEPGAREQELVAVATNLAGIAIERRSAEAGLRQSEELLRLVGEATDDAVWDWRLVSGALWWGEGIRALTGKTPGELEPGIESWTSRIHPADRDRVVAGIHAVIQSGGRSWTDEYRFVRGDGSYAHILDRGHVIRDETDRPVRMVGSMMDVTERTRAHQALAEREEQLRESQRRLRALTARREAILEDERARISREIHDELGQILTASKLDVAWVRDSLPAAPSDIRARLDELASRFDATVKTVRRITTELRPVVLDQLGLGPAVEWLARDFSHRTGLRCSVRAALDGRMLPPETATGLFRILQEALTNVARHAGAAAVQVELWAVKDTVCLEVRDDGQGMPDADVAHREGLGIMGMRERAILLGGALEVGTQHPTGTRVSVWAPIP